MTATIRDDGKIGTFFVIDGDDTPWTYWVSQYEKETILRTSKGDKEYSIYTFDLALQRKLDKFVKEYPNLCKLTAETKEGSKSYEIEKTRVSIRLMTPYSEEQKRRAKKRINDIHKTN